MWAAAIILMSWLVSWLSVMYTLNLTVNFLFASVFLSLWPRVFPFLTSQDALLQSFDAWCTWTADSQSKDAFLLKNCVSAVIGRSSLTSQRWATAGKTEWHPIFRMHPRSTTPSDDVTLNCVQAPENIVQDLLSCQSSRRGFKSWVELCTLHWPVQRLEQQTPKRF